MYWELTHTLPRCGTDFVNTTAADADQYLVAVLLRCVLCGFLETWRKNHLKSVKFFSVLPNKEDQRLYPQINFFNRV